MEIFKNRSWKIEWWYWTVSWVIHSFKSSFAFSDSLTYDLDKIYRRFVPKLFKILESFLKATPRSHGEGHYFSSPYNRFIFSHLTIIDSSTYPFNNATENLSYTFHFKLVVYKNYKAWRITCVQDRTYYKLQYLQDFSHIRAFVDFGQNWWKQF